MRRLTHFVDKLKLEDLLIYFTDKMMKIDPSFHELSMDHLPDEQSFPSAR